MTDRTTAGIEAEPDEVEAVLHNLCGFHLAERDPVARYMVLTREQVLYDALVAAIKRERGRALAELVGRGHRMTEIATLTGLRTRQQVQRLIQLGTSADKASSTQAVDDVQEASRQFDERLAAVEATLDEVVSGIVNEAAPVSPAVGDAATGDPAMGDPGTGKPAMGVRLDPGMTEELAILKPGVVLTGSGAYPAVVPVVPGAPVGSADPDFDPLTADLEELTGMLEPTQVMPALSLVTQPTREMRADDPWRRRRADDDVT
jgi:hypothetical protein